MYRDTIFNFHKINNYCIKMNTGESTFGMCLGRVLFRDALNTKRY